MAAKKMNIYQKLAEAREMIANTKIKRAGRNTYSNYDYFTPDQIHQLVESSCRKLGLITLYRLKKNELGHFGELDIVDIESGEKITLTQSTAVPDLKATNIAQKIGGTVTYNERYLTMSAFKITDNSLDFDAQDNRMHSSNTVAEKPIVNKATHLHLKEITPGIFKAMLKSINEGKAEDVRIALPKYFDSANKTKIINLLKTV